MNKRTRRIVVAVGALIVLAVVLFFSGAAEYFSRENVRALVLGAGALGYVLYVALFAAALCIQIPGMPFTFAAVLTWGWREGSLLVYFGAWVATCAAFEVVRMVGGQPLGKVRNKHVERALGVLARRPIATVALLRTLLWASPGVNVSLAITDLSRRDHAIGSAIGLLPASVFMAWWVDKVLAHGGDILALLRLWIQQLFG